MRKPVTWGRFLWSLGFVVFLFSMIPFSRCSTMNLETVPIQSLSSTDFETTIIFFEDPEQTRAQRGNSLYLLALFEEESSYKGIMMFMLTKTESMIAYAIGDPLSDPLSWSMGAPVTHFRWLDLRSLKLIFLELSPYLQQNTIIHAFAFTANSSLEEVEESSSSIIQFYGDEFIDSSTSSTTTTTETTPAITQFTISGYQLEILIPVVFVGVSVFLIYTHRKK